MQIIPIYDAAANADQSFKSDVQTAINILDAIFSAPITVRLDIEKGEYRSHDMSFYGYNQNTSLGDINEDLAATLSYSSLRTDLIKAVPGFFSDASLPNVASINGHSIFAISPAEERIFGILPAINSTNSVDGYVGIGTGFSAGNVRVSAALHEIGHALGRVPDIVDGAPGMLALWRFTGVGTHLFTDGGVPSPPAYFSLDGGVTNLADWGQNSDPSDFLNNSKTNNDPFNEIVSNLGNLTSLDKLIMEALGFDTGSFYTLPITAGDLMALQQGIQFFTDPVAANNQANAINQQLAGGPTVFSYAQSLLAANVSLSQVAMADFAFGVGQTDTVSHLAAISTQFLPPQVSFANAQQFAGGATVYAAQVYALALAALNGGNNPFAANLNNLISQGDVASFASAVSGLTGTNTDAIQNFFNNWSGFYSKSPLAAPGIPAQLAAAASAWGDAMGVALVDTNAANVTAHNIQQQVANALFDIAETGTAGGAAYTAGVSIKSLAPHTPLQGEGPRTVTASPVLDSVGVQSIKTNVAVGSAAQTLPDREIINGPDLLTIVGVTETEVNAHANDFLFG